MYGLPSICKSPQSDVCSWYDSFNEHMPVWSSAIICIIFWHHIHNTLTLWSKVTLKKSTDTHRIHTVYAIWTFTNVATSAHHRSLTWARLFQSMPSNTTSLTLILLTWRIWWAPNNDSKWQMGFFLAFKGLISIVLLSFQMLSYIQIFLPKLPLDISQLPFKLHSPCPSTFITFPSR